VNAGESVTGADAHRRDLRLACASTHRSRTLKGVGPVRGEMLARHRGIKVVA
jgi:hypothetical protein